MWFNRQNDWVRFKAVYMLLNVHTCKGSHTETSSSLQKAQGELNVQNCACIKPQLNSATPITVTAAALKFI